MIRLLIADDECLEREALTEMVSRRFEHEAVLETAENGRKAADTAILWGADLILMDIEMPGMSGLDAARAVLAQRPGCRVIFVTAYSLFQYAHEAVHLGACDYLLKPVDPDELEASIRRAMRQIETERKLEALAPVQPEPMEPAAPAAEPDDAENSQNALVMAHVRRYLEDNYMFDISLDSVGEILHISPAYLSAQFKKYQKMNFLDCLTELRINAAKELLTDPFRSSAEVASMVGYEDASYFARVSLSQLAEYMPALNVLQLPFLYQDAGQMWRVLDGNIGDEFLTRLDDIDLTGLSWFDAGVRSFYTRRKVTCLAELQGLRLRVQESDTMSMMVSALGADPVQVVYSQVYAALHNGQIDGAENNWPSYEAMSHYEVAPYFLRDEHTRVPEIQLASIPAMEKLAALDPTFPGILRSCAWESALIERTLWAEQEAGAEQDMLARGIVVTELSSEEKQKFRAAVQPLYDQFAEQAELIARIQKS